MHHAPTRVIGGIGSLARIGQELSRFSRKCLVVTGRRSARLSGLLTRILELLGSANIEGVLFDQVEPNPSVETVNDGANLARSSRARWVLGVGGGSALDAAKAIALMAVNQGDIRPFFQGMRSENAPFPVVAIPTTAGTGSEVTQYAVVTDVKEHDKFALAIDELFPKIAILDPELSVSMPENVTVDTGLDALCHAIEALLAKRRSEYADLLAVEAIRRITTNLPVVRSQPDNLAARAQMLFAANLAGLAIADTATLAPHAMGFPITARYDLPHGRATALLEPAFLERMSALEPKRTALVGELLGNPEDAAAAMRDFMESLGVAPQLGAYGMRDGDIEAFARTAMTKRNLENSPGQWDEPALQDVYKRSL